MTSSFETPDTTGDQLVELGQRDIPANDSCGESIDWYKGVSALPRNLGRSPEVSEMLLTKVIERDIIPRLFLAHRDSANGPRGQQKAQPNLASFDSDIFAKLVLSSEPESIMQRIEELIDCGMSLKAIYLDVMAPVARRLGELWEEDRCTFTDVTIGLSRLHQVLREVGRHDQGETRRQSKIRRAFLVPAPGDQHSFGLSIVEEFFLHAGWETAYDPAASANSILESVSKQKIDVLGFSLACEGFIEPLSELIDKAQRASRNQDIVIMVGGGLLVKHPEYSERISGATIISDAVNAVQTAELLVSHPPQSLVIQ